MLPGRPPLSLAVDGTWGEGLGRFEELLGFPGSFPGMHVTKLGLGFSC